MFFSISTRWSPLVGLALLVLGGVGLKVGISEGHEVIGAGLAMLTLSRREDRSEPGDALPRAKALPPGDAP